MEDIRTYIKDNILIFDGAMGTMLKTKGWDMKKSSETLNITNEEWVVDIHKDYIESGAKAITTNTFMCNKFNAQKYSYSVEEMVKIGINIARKAIKDKNIYLALSVGPTGEFFKAGDKNINNIYENYSNIAKSAEEEGSDVILLETFMHIQEAEIAIKAIKNNCKLPIFCTMSTWNGENFFRGISTEYMCNILLTSGCDVIGVNCSNSPKYLYNITSELLKFSKSPIMIKPNAGALGIKGGKCSGYESEKEFTKDIKEFVRKGVKIIGGCCGTTPKYINEIRKAIFKSK